MDRWALHTIHPMKNGIFKKKKKKKKRCNAMGYVRKEEAEAWWFRCWSTEIVAGEDRRTREADA
jgi:hypothetical protein